MSTTLVYTFRTNKHVSVFKQVGIEVFVFGKLKQDLVTFQRLIHIVKPQSIIGLAEVKGRSVIETRAVNAFGRAGTIHKNGKAAYKLSVPKKRPFSLSKKPTRSFCNWTTYKICEFAESKSIRVHFIHYNPGDLPDVIYFIDDIR